MNNLNQNKSNLRSKAKKGQNQKQLIEQDLISIFEQNTD